MYTVDARITAGNLPAHCKPPCSMFLRRCHFPSKHVITQRRCLKNRTPGAATGLLLLLLLLRLDRTWLLPFRPAARLLLRRLCLCRHLLLLWLADRRPLCRMLSLQLCMGCSRRLRSLRHRWVGPWRRHIWRKHGGLLLVVLLRRRYQGHLPLILLLELRCPTHVLLHVQALRRRGALTRNPWFRPSSTWVAYTRHDPDFVERNLQQ